MDAQQRLGEALRAADTTGATAVDLLREAGRSLARDGAPLGEALDALRAASRAHSGREPGFGDARALAEGWADQTVAHLEGVTCEDPLTGLASAEHLRARLAELARAPRPAGVPPSLLVVDAAAPDEPFAAALRLAEVGESVRAALPGATVARVGRARVVALVEGDAAAGRADLLRRLLGEAATGVRVSAAPS